MKKIVCLLLTLLAGNLIFAQDISDAMRYAQNNLNGTARFSAMGGAFGALGGDMSALNVNPAGSAVFANNHVAITLSNYNVNNTSTYFGKQNTASNNTFDLNQAGGVLVFSDAVRGSDWKKFALAINYENGNNLYNSITSSGYNPNSVANYFLHYANRDGGVSLSNLTLQSNESITSLYDYLGSNYGYGAQQAFLGYQAYIINPATNYNETTNRKYVSAVPSGGNYYQENTLESTGYNGKASFNGSAQYGDKLYLGLNLNSHFSNYRQSTVFYEDNANNLTSGVQRLQFKNDLYTVGSGFSFQLGAIAKVTKQVRLGLAYESPTWYQLTDQLSQRVVAVSADKLGDLPADNVNPDVVNIYDPYRLQTPGKITGSFAYVYKKSGLLSVDYSRRDYSNLMFTPKSDFSDLNTIMANSLGATNELRIGGEYRIKEWSLRGGYRFQDSPYKNQKTIGNLNAYSAGIGYNFGSSRLDFAYTLLSRRYDYQFFSQGLTDYATIHSKLSNITVTLCFEL